MQSDTSIQTLQTSDAETEDFSSLITGNNILACFISAQEHATLETTYGDGDTINIQKYFVSSERQSEIDPETGYALFASSLEQEGKIFTFIQHQNYVALDLMSP